MPVNNGAEMDKTKPTEWDASKFESDPTTVESFIPDYAPQETSLAQDGSGFSIGHIEPSKTFGEAFASARKSGAKAFEWNGKQYTTNTKEESKNLGRFDNVQAGASSASTKSPLSFTAASGLIESAPLSALAGIAAMSASPEDKGEEAREKVLGKSLPLGVKPEKAKNYFKANNNKAGIKKAEDADKAYREAWADQAMSLAERSRESAPSLTDSDKDLAREKPGTAAALSSGAQLVAGLAGQTEFANQLREKGRRLQPELLRKDVNEVWNDDQLGDWLLLSAAEGVPSAIGTVIAALSGNPLVLGAYITAMGGSAVGNKYHENIKAGMPADQAGSNALFTGIGEAGSEYVGIKVLKHAKSAWDKLPANVKQKAISKVLGGVGLAGAMTLEEAGEEGVNRAWENAVDYATATGTPGNAIKGEAQELSPWAGDYMRPIHDKVLTSMAKGAVGGALASPVFVGGAMQGKNDVMAQAIKDEVDARQPIAPESIGKDGPATQDYEAAAKKVFGGNAKDAAPSPTPRLTPSLEDDDATGLADADTSRFALRQEDGPALPNYDFSLDAEDDGPALPNPNFGLDVGEDEPAMPNPDFSLDANEQPAPMPTPDFTLDQASNPGQMPTPVFTLDKNEPKPVGPLTSALHTARQQSDGFDDDELLGLAESASKTSSTAAPPESPVMEGGDPASNDTATTGTLAGQQDGLSSSEIDEMAPFKELLGKKTAIRSETPASQPAATIEQAAPIGTTVQAGDPLAASINVVPEPDQAINAQIDAMLDERSGKDAVLVPVGSNAPAQLPETVHRVDLGQQGELLTTSADKAASAAFDALQGPVSDAKMGQILYGIPGGKPEDITHATVVRNKDGVPIAEILTGPSNQAHVNKAAENIARPEDTVTKEDPDAVVVERIQEKNEEPAAMNPVAEEAIVGEQNATTGDQSGGGVSIQGGNTSISIANANEPGGDATIINRIEREDEPQKAPEDLVNTPKPSAENVEIMESALKDKKIDLAANEAATSPANDLAQPTEAQKEAGNYKVGRVRVNGLDISIENPKGSVRSGVDSDGERWESTMQSHYGYIRGTQGRDKDHVDIFLTEGASRAKTAWVVDQVNQDGAFDEHKIILGPSTQEEAERAYLSNYEEGWTGMGAIAGMPINDFRAWVKNPKKTRKPLAYKAPPRRIRPSNDLILRIKQLGGINIRYRSDVLSDNKGGPVGLFSKAGRGLDDLATELQAEGFDIDIHDVDGGVASLVDLLQGAVSGRQVLNHYGQEAARQRDAEIGYRESLLNEIESLGGSVAKNASTVKLEGLRDSLRAQLSAEETKIAEQIEAIIGTELSDADWDAILNAPVMALETYAQDFDITAFKQREQEENDAAYRDYEEETARATEERSTRKAGEDVEAGSSKQGTQEQKDAKVDAVLKAETIALTRRRAAANQVGLGNVLGRAIDKAKEIIEWGNGGNNTLTSAWFKRAAKKFEDKQDPVTAGHLRAIADRIKELSRAKKAGVATDEPVTAQATTVQATGQDGQSTEPDTQPKSAQETEGDSVSGVQGESEVFGLDGQTEAEIRAEEAAIAERERQDDAERERVENERRQKLRREDDAARNARVLAEREAAKKKEINDARDNFQLGQEPPKPVDRRITNEDRAGQVDIFTQPAKPATSSKPTVPVLRDGILDNGRILIEGYYSEGYPWETGWQQESGASIAQDGKDIIAAGDMYDGHGMMLRDAIRHAEIKGDYVPKVAYEKLDSMRRKDNKTRAKPVDTSGEVLLSSAQDNKTATNQPQPAPQQAGEVDKLADKNQPPINENQIDSSLGEPTDLKNYAFADSAPSQGETSTEQQVKVSPNTVFTADAAAAARALLKKKLGQLNSGIDPEVMQAGITLAGYHIEAGARSFAAYAKAMIADLGDMVKPYLKSWYAAVTLDPRAANMDGMDDLATVQGADVEAILKSGTEKWVLRNKDGKTVRDIISRKPMLFDSKEDAQAFQDSSDAIAQPRTFSNTMPARGQYKPDLATQKEIGNEPNQRSSTDLERNRQDTRNQNGMGAQGVRPGRERDGGPGEPGVRRPAQENQPAGGERVPGREAAPAGTESDFSPFAEAPGAEPGVAGSDLDQRSGDLGLFGQTLEPAGTEATDRVAQGGIGLIEKRQAQTKAQNVKVVPGNRANISESLPFLLEGQKDDVAFAEARFAKPDGYGVLFTNGTGTGKTYSGLGVIKRFERQGKSNILIVVPSDKIASDWVRSGQDLKLDITALENTNDAGQGIVITTYANMGANNALVNRKWDLVVADESHYMMQAKDGGSTQALDNLRAITMHPRGRFERHSRLYAKEIARRSELIDKITINSRIMNLDDTMDQMIAALRDENATMEAEAKKLDDFLREKREQVKEEVDAAQGINRTRTVFLSATPFAYEKTVDYAEGYLFNYAPDGARGGYNSGSPFDRFMMQHFGYRMRYNKLNEPGPEVNRGLMQRQFNSWLKSEKVLSGRILDVEHDYDRKFILVDSAIGAELDRAMQWIWDRARDQTNPNKEGYSALQSKLSEKFDHLTRRYLLEAIKAKEAIPIIRAHLDMGRKVVVFHDFKKGGGFNPVRFGKRDATQASENNIVLAYNAAIEAFNAEFSGLIESPMWNAASPIAALSAAFPDALLFNGDVPAKKRRENAALFNDDESGKNLIIGQSAAMKEGVSLHDTTGRHQRVLINLGLPTQPTTAIQQEGRIFRVGQASNAIFRYLNTGTNWERFAFATSVAQRASAAENLAVGEEARALMDAFIEGFEESDTYPAGHDGEGTGGKARDQAANQALTEWDRAMTLYFAQHKRTSRDKSLEGVDYFATPEPLGLKMVEWADIRDGDKALEPSAGHGAIARWLPDNIARTVVEPSSELASRLKMVVGDARLVQEQFEQLDTAANKYDAIVMNPPFGVGGKTAIEHVAKAAKHLNNGGRIVALIPTGPAADKRFDKWFYEEEQKPVKPLMEHPTLGPIYKGDVVKTSYIGRQYTGKIIKRDSAGNVWMKTDMPGEQLYPQDTWVDIIEKGPRAESFRPAENLHLRADIRLPQVTFERAGTRVAARVVVIEKQTNTEAASGIQTSQRDYTDTDNIKDFFERIKDAGIPPRATATGQSASVQSIATPEQAAQAVQASMTGFKLAQTKHAIKGIDLYVATLDKRVEHDEYKRIEKLAKRHGGYYSPYDKKGAIPGFQFESEADRTAFLDEFRVNGNPASTDGIAIRENESGYSNVNSVHTDPYTIDVDGVTRPTVNSNGQPIAQTKEGLRNFWRWFKGSRVVDDQGRPLVVYHGTTKAGFSEFRTNTQSKVEGAYFFTSNRRMARSYSGRGEDIQLLEDEDGVYSEHDSGIYPVYLRMTSDYEAYFDGANGDGARAEPVYNLYDTEGDIIETVYTVSEAEDAVAEGRAESYEADDQLWTTTDSEVRAAQRAGQDGIALLRVMDNGSEFNTYETGDVFVVFDPAQIKSATGNIGTFDPNNANILRDPGYTDPYDNLEARPDTTQAQMDAGRTALADAEARIFGAADYAGWGADAVPRLLGSAISADFREDGGTVLIGKEVSNSNDLAILAQVYRDPRFETFRIFYTDDAGKIIGQQGYSSRLAAAVYLPDDIAGHIDAGKRNHGASGYWITHNHPSGSSRESIADLDMTGGIHSKVPGFRGHVIIDHNEYTTILPDEDGLLDTETINADWLNGIDLHANAEAAHPTLGAYLLSADDAVTIAKSVQSATGYMTIIGRSAEGKVSMLLEVPEIPAGAALGKAKLKLLAMLRRAMRETGSSTVFAVVNGNINRHTAVMDSGIFTDVVSPDTGQSSFYSGKMPITKADKRGGKHYVAQPVWHVNQGNKDYYDHYIQQSETFNSLPADQRSALPWQGLVTDGINESGRAAAVRRGRYSLLANGIAADFMGKGQTSLVGQKISNSHDLAVLAQTYRNPQLETSRFFFVKGGTVVSQTAVSSRKPGVSKVFIGESMADMEAFVADISEQAKALGADTVWMLHNHPSGDPTPSEADAKATNILAQAFEANGLNVPGHVIINQHRYSVLDVSQSGVEYRPVTHDFGAQAQYDINNPKQAHALLGKRIGGAGDLALMAKLAQVSPGQIVIIGESGTAGVRVIAEVTPGQLSGPMAAGILRRIAKQTGSDRLFAYGITPEQFESAQKAIRKGLLVDAIIIDGGIEYSTTGITQDRPEKGYWDQPTLDRIAMLERNGEKLDAMRVSEEQAGYDTRLSRQMWFSPLARAFESIPAKVDGTSAKNVKLWLTSNKAKFGLKDDEIQWSGILDYLDLRGKDKVTKAEVVDYLSGNGVKVQDVVKGRDTPTVSEADLDVGENEEGIFEAWVGGGLMGTGDTREEAIRDAMEELRSADLVGGNTKFSGYWDSSYKSGIPGTYREILVTLPTKEVKHTRDNVFIDAEETAQRGKADTDLFWFVRGPDNVYQIPKRKAPTEQDAVDYVIREKKPTPDATAFKGNHWDEPNVLVHVRLDEVIGGDGKRYVRVGEIQSDWGQDGKKVGFNVGNIGKATVRQNSDGYWDVVDALGHVIDTAVSEQAARRSIERFGSDVRITAAPFVTDTKAWVALGIKRAIMHAMDVGADGVVFGTGEQNANLYDLSKQVRSIEWDWHDRKARRKIVNIRPDGGNVIEFAIDKDGIAGGILGGRIGSEFDGKHITDIVGKDVGEQILAKEYGELSGDGLKVGGAGMRKFYDSIVPQVANEVLKKLGGGKVEPIGFGHGLQLKRGENGGAFGVVVMPVQHIQPGFQFTDAMKSKVSREGMPLFSITGRFSPTGHEGYFPAIKKSLSGMTSSVPSIRSMAGASSFKVMDVPPVIRNVIAKDGSKPFKRLNDGIWGSGSSIASKAIDTHAASYHGDTVDNSVVINLPYLLADPVAVFSSEGGMNSNSYRVLVPGAVVAIEPKGKQGYVMTVHPLSESSVRMWAENGLLHYYDDTNTETARQARNGQFATLNKAVDISVALNAAKNKGRIVVTKSDIVNLPSSSLSARRGTTGMALRDLNAVVSSVSSQNKNMPKVNVLAHPSDLNANDATQAALLNYIQNANAMNDVEGATHDGEIYLFASGIKDEARAEHVLATHEVTHYGLRAVFGQGLDPVLQSIYATNGSVRKSADKLRAGLGLRSNLDAVEEVLADMRPQDLIQLRGWRKLVKLMRDWLGRHGFNSLSSQLDRLLKSGVSDQAKADMLVADVVTSARDWVKYGNPARNMASGTALQRDMLPRMSKDRGAGDNFTDQTPTQPGRELTRAMFDAGKSFVSEIEKLAERYGTVYIRWSPTSKRDLSPASNSRDFVSGSTHNGLSAVEITDKTHPVDIAKALSEYMFLRMQDARSRPRIYLADRVGTDTDSHALIRPKKLLMEVPDDIIVAIDRGFSEAFALDDEVATAERRLPRISDPIGRKITEDSIDKAKSALEALLANDQPQRQDGADIRLSRRGQGGASNDVLASARAKAGLAHVGFVDRMKGYAANVFNPNTYDLRERGDEFRQGNLDRFYGALRAERRTLGNLPAEQSPYVALRLATGTSSVMRAVLLYGLPRWAQNKQHLEKVPGSKGLLEILSPVKDDINDFLGWMVGNRAQRLIAEGKENNLTQDEINALKALGDGREQVFGGVAKEFAAFKRGMLDMAEEAGLIDGGARRVWDRADWIPFYREMDEQVAGPRNRKGYSHQNSGIRLLRGGESAINDPLENIIMNFHHLVDASLKNNALTKVVDVLGEDAGIERVGFDIKGAIVPRPVIRKQLLLSGVPESLVDAMPDDVFDGMAKMISIQAPTQKDVIRIMRNGKAEYYRVTDPLLLRAATAFSSFDIPGLDAARAFKRLLTTTVTSTPDFWLRNWIRDSASAKIIAKDGTKITGAVTGIFKSYRETGGFEDMLFAGASFAGGYIDGTDPESAARSIRRSLRNKGYSAVSINEFLSSLIDSPSKLWEKYREAGEAVENANREAVYESVMSATGSVTDAAFAAKDLMDFSLRGDSATYQLFADVIPFFNARVQGLYRLGRTDPRRLAVAALMLTLPSVLLAMWNIGNDDDDRYGDLKDWERDSYWHFWIKGEHFRIPKPFELGVLFATIPERVTMTLMGEESGKKLAKRVAWNAMEQLNLVQMPQIIAPAVETAFNYDTFRDANIENMSDENVLPTERYDERTSYTMRLLSQSAPGASNTLGASPKKLEHLFLGYTGTMGAYALTLADYISRELDDAPDRPSLRQDQIPLLSVLYRGAEPPTSGQAVEDVYKMAKEAKQAWNSIKELEKSGDFERSDELIDRYGEKADATGFSTENAPAWTVKSAVKKLSDIKKEVELIEADPIISPEDKREQIDSLYRERNEIARDAAKEARPAFGY